MTQVRAGPQSRARREGPMFGRKRPYDRSETLARADGARAKGRKRKAISEYRKILEQDPKDFAVHQRIAPLLAQAGEADDARKSFAAAAAGHLEQGFADRAIAVHTQAVAFFPTDEALWNEVARLHRERARKADAVKVYLQAHQHFRDKPLRPHAIAFLRAALELEPLHLEALVALARLLKQAGQKAEALRVLAEASTQVRGPGLKRLRKAEWQVSRSLRSLWSWLRT